MGCVMENQLLENRDISEYQELFAYEMTEVLLKLKDEFAVISAPEQLQDALANAPAFEMRRPDFFFLPAVARAERKISAPTTPVPGNYAIPAVKRAEKAVVLPKMELSGVYALPAVARTERKISAPTTPVPGNYAIPAVRKAENLPRISTPRKIEHFSLPSVQRTSKQMQVPDVESVIKTLIKHSPRFD